MNRSIISKLILLCFSVFLLASIFTIDKVAAETVTKQRIYDDAGLLSPDEVDELEAVAKEYSDLRETDFIILTTKETNGKDVEKYMQDFYDEKGLGYNKKHGNTAILTVDMHDMKNKEVYLAGFYKGEKYLSSKRMDQIREKITPDLKNKDYYNAFYDFIETSSEYMGISPLINPESIFFELWFQVVVALTLAAIVVGIMLLNFGAKVTVNSGTYQDNNNSRVLQQRDRYIRTTLTKVKNSTDSSSGGGGGTTGGGHSHSGSRGSF